MAHTKEEKCVVVHSQGNRLLLQDTSNLKCSAVQQRVCYCIVLKKKTYIFNRVQPPSTPQEWAVKDKSESKLLLSQDCFSPAPDVQIKNNKKGQQIMMMLI